MTEFVTGKLVDLVISSACSCIKQYRSDRSWKNMLVGTGKFFCEHENNADKIFDDLAVALSEQNMAELSKELAADSGYEIEKKLYNYLVSLLRSCIRSGKQAEKRPITG